MAMARLTTAEAVEAAERDQRRTSAVGLHPDGAGVALGETGDLDSPHNGPGFVPEEQSKGSATKSPCRPPAMCPRACSLQATDRPAGGCASLFP